MKSIRMIGAAGVFALSITCSTQVFADLATSEVIFDWGTFNYTTTGDLVVSLGNESDEGSAFADGGLLDSDSTSGFGGINVTSVGTSATASVVTTTDMIDAFSTSTAGYAGAIFERAFSFEALSGSGNLFLSVDVAVQAQVQGTSATADAEALFGYEIGNFGVQANLVGLELYGSSGDKSETLKTTLDFVVSMETGDMVNMFAEGGAEVSAVPVPAAFWLFGSGLLGLIGMSKKRK